MMMRKSMNTNGDDDYQLICTKYTEGKTRDVVRLVPFQIHSGSGPLVVAAGTPLHTAMSQTGSGEYVTISKEMAESGPFRDLKTFGDHIPMNVGKEPELGGITLLGPELDETGGIKTHQAFQTKLYRVDKNFFAIIVHASFCKDGILHAKNFVFHAAFIPSNMAQSLQKKHRNAVNADFKKDMNKIFEKIQKDVVDESPSFCFMDKAAYEDDKIEFVDSDTFKRNIDAFSKIIENIFRFSKNFSVAEQIGASIVQEKFRTGLSIHN